MVYGFMRLLVMERGPLPSATTRRASAFPTAVLRLLGPKAVRLPLGSTCQAFEFCLPPLFPKHHAPVRQCHEGGDTCSDADLSADSGAKCATAGLWDPAFHVAEQFPPRGRWETQAAVLATNLVHGLQRLPLAMLSQMAECLCASNARVAAEYRVASALLAIAPHRLQRLVKKTLAQPPLRPRPAPVYEPQVPPKEQEQQRDVLTTLTSVALGCRASHASASEFLRWVSRFEAEGVSVGQKYHTRAFYQDVEFLAARAVREMDSADAALSLPGLGIPSDFAVLLDGVPVGGTRSFGRHGSVTVVCVTAASPFTCHLFSRLAAWCVLDAGHSGVEMADAVLGALAAPPVSLTSSVLRSRLTLVGGDGAVAMGGPERPNPGTGAAEHIWASTHVGVHDGPDVPLAELGEAPRKRFRRKTADEQRLHFCTDAGGHWYLCTSRQGGRGGCLGVREGMAWRPGRGYPEATCPLSCAPSD